MHQLFDLTLLHVPLAVDDAGSSDVTVAPTESEDNNLGIIHTCSLPHSLIAELILPPCIRLLDVSPLVAPHTPSPPTVPHLHSCQTPHLIPDYESHTDRHVCCFCGHAAESPVALNCSHWICACHLRYFQSSGPMQTPERSRNVGCTCPCTCKGRDPVGSSSPLSPKGKGKAPADDTWPASLPFGK